MQHHGRVCRNVFGTMTVMIIVLVSMEHYYLYKFVSYSFCTCMKLFAEVTFGLQLTSSTRFRHLKSKFASTQCMYNHYMQNLRCLNLMEGLFFFFSTQFIYIHGNLYFEGTCYTTFIMLYQMKFKFNAVIIGYTRAEDWNLEKCEWA